MAVEVSRPAMLAEPRKAAASSALRPISLRVAALALRVSLSCPTSTPVFCPTVFRASSISPASSASIPKAASTLLTESTEAETSVLFRAANLINCADRSSSSCPVRPKRVLTSPMAAPAVSKSVGIVVVMSVRMPCISLRASPVAPVLVTMVSRPLSTSVHAATAATPAAVRGPVTAVVRVFPAELILSPMPLIMLSPVALPALSPAGVAALVSSSVSVRCAPSRTGVTVSVACATSGMFSSPLFFEPLLQLIGRKRAGSDVPLVLAVLSGGRSGVWFRRSRRFSRSHRHQVCVDGGQDVVYIR